MATLKEIEIIEWLTLIAILVGPFLGIFVYGQIEERKKAYQRKLDVFKTLMATRAALLTPEHVYALNRIDIEFTESGADEKAVRDAWTAYHDHLSGGPQPPQLPPPNADQATRDQYQTDYQQHQTRLENWAKDGQTRLAALLLAMGKLFKYDFNETQIKKAAYRPQRHDDIENAQLHLLTMAGQVFGGKYPLLMHVSNWPAPPEEQGQLVETILSAVEDGAYKVRIVEPEQAQD